MAGQNLWRTRLRTFLTLIGVVIGIGALISMVSFGTGLEKNITEKLKSNDMFTSLTISTKAVSFNRKPTDRNKTADTTEKAVLLNDSLLHVLQARPEVAIVYPKLNLPVRIELGSNDATTYAGNLPMEMKGQAPYNQLYAGHFFSNDSAQEVIVSLKFFEHLGIELSNKAHISNHKRIDTTMQLALADTMIGKTIHIYTASLKSMSPLALMMGGVDELIKEHETQVKIVGITKETQFAGPNLSEDILLPMQTAKSLPNIGFNRVSDFLDKATRGNQYNSIYVKTKSMEDLAVIKTFLDQQHINYFSIDDGLGEMKKAFLILDSILGILGFISLMVAGFGIVNTMLMSILERRREIGIMKAIGGKNRDIRMIFFFEAGFIGVVGALGGIAMGWALTRIANFVVNESYIKGSEDYVNLFSFPWWLISGSIAFAVLISLLAGLYPAIKASKINPIDALRQTD